VDESGVSLGERVLPTSSRDCAEIVKSLALAISIAIVDLDTPPPPGAPSTPAAPPPAALPEREARPPASPPPPVSPPAQGGEPPPPAKETSRGIGAAVQGGGLVAVAAAPATSIGVTIGAQVIGSWWAFGMEGRYDRPASDAISGSGRIETRLTLGAASACLWTGQRARAFACLVGAVGSFTASARDVTAPLEASALYVGAGGRVGGELDVLAPVYTFVRVGALGAFTPHRALVNGGVVYTLPPMSVDVGLGLGVRFL
jgi:hypothetical protein